VGRTGRRPTARLAPVPDPVGFEQAAALPLAGLTALRTLRLGGDLLGRRVLVTGAGGALGAMQVQLAVTAGAEVTAVARPQHDKQPRQHGARSVVADPSDANGLFHLVTDWVGGASLAAALGKIGPREHDRPRLRKPGQDADQHLRLLRPRRRAAGRLPVLRPP
jgi:NADPH:quinone reductase